MYSMEDAIKRTLHDIQDMEDVNAVLPAVKKLLKAWDGKVLNKRLDTALQELNLPGRIYLSDSYKNSWEIRYKPEKANDWYIILWGHRPTCHYFDPAKSFVNENKRIDASRCNELIEEKRIERLKTIQSYKNHLETWETKKAQLSILSKEIDTLINSIPYTMRDYFNMNYRRY